MDQKLNKTIDEVLEALHTDLEVCNDRVVLIQSLMDVLPYSIDNEETRATYVKSLTSSSSKVVYISGLIDWMTGKAK